MELTRKQEEGLRIALERYNAHEKYTTISGYAGTGKSTLVRFIIEALDVDEDKVCYATFTGKAAEVLRRKGNKNAMTLHRLLYDSFPRQGGGFLRVPKKCLYYTVVVVDEVSMVPKSMINMLLNHQVYILFLGDPFQLPMIDKNESHDILDHPHVFLDQIMRQAEESEIIRLTLDIREQKMLIPTKGNEVMILPKKEFITGQMTWADQIICATNLTRHTLNNQMRELLGYEGNPQSGEKMICLRNYWGDTSTDGESVLVNGITGIIKNPFETFRDIPWYVKVANHRMPEIQCDFYSDDGSVYLGVEMDKKMIENETPCLDWRESYAVGKLVNKIGDIIPRQFTYGYVVSCHKAQGSEWDKVLTIEERFPFDKIEHARWLYTACTRSSQKLVLIQQ